MLVLIFYHLTSALHMMIHLHILFCLSPSVYRIANLRYKLFSFDRARFPFLYHVAARDSTLPHILAQFRARSCDRHHPEFPWSSYLCRSRNFPTGAIRSHDIYRFPTDRCKKSLETIELLPYHDVFPRSTVPNRKFRLCENDPVHDGNLK